MHLLSVLENRYTVFSHALVHHSLYVVWLGNCINSVFRLKFTMPDKNVITNSTTSGLSDVFLFIFILFKDFVPDSIKGIA